MKKILIQEKYQYVALTDNNNELTYFLTRIAKEKDEKILYFRNPFDIWDNIHISEEKLLEAFKDDKRFLRYPKNKFEEERTFECHLFQTEEALISFLDSKEPEERKLLREKYKGVSILDIPIGDLKKMGIEPPL